MKKKLVALMLVGALSCTVLACGGESDNTNNDTTVEENDSDETADEKEEKSDATDEVTPSIEVSDEESAAGDLYDHISNEDYMEMLNKYDAIFTGQMSIFTTQQISTLIEQNADTDLVVAEISRVLEELDSAKTVLSDYFLEFDKDRTAAPMGTKIMTLLSHAQSAVTQYELAISYLNDYLTYSADQEYIDKFQKYTQKTKDSIETYNEVLNSEKELLESISASTQIPEPIVDAATESSDVNSVQQQVEVRAVPTLDGEVCTFITNNSDTIIDELSVQVLYKDDAGNTMDMDESGHDMVLPGSTVVSQMDAPDSYATIETTVSVELGVNPGYENHATDVQINANQGEDCIILEITNNSSVDIEEIEYIVVLYKGDTLVSVKNPNDIYDVAAGQTITQKENTYNEDYDRFEVYLNQSHTFGI